MNRKLIAISVAAALAAPAAATLFAPAAIADVTVFGKVRASYGKVDDDREGSLDDSDQWELNNQASRIGFKGSEDLGGGLKANFFLEWGVDIDGESDGQNNGKSDDESILSRRNQWVGLSGDNWGEVRFGRHDTPLKFSQGKFDVFNDQQGDFAGSWGSNGNKMVRGDLRVDNVLAYITPNFNGFKAAIAAIPGEGEEANPGSTNTDQDGAADFFSLGATYSNGPIFLSAGYDSFDAGTPGAGAPEQEDDRYRLIGTYKFDAFQIGALYEATDFKNNGGPGEHDQYDVWGLSGKFSFGNNAVKAMYLDGTMDLEADSDEDFQQISVGIDHNFSKRTSVYAEYTNKEADYGSGSGNSEELTFTGVGINHSF